MLHARWQRHLAVVAAYRDQYKITDDIAAQLAGPYIEKGRAGHHPYWQATAAAVAARRIATTPIGPATTGDPTQQARHQLATDVYRTLPESDQAEILRTVATRTGAVWLADLPRLDDAALAQDHVAEQISTALAERRQLTPEVVQPQSEKQRQPTRKPHRVPPRRAEPAEQHQTRAPEQRPNGPHPAVQQPPPVHQSPQGPRLR